MRGGEGRAGSNLLRWEHSIAPTVKNPIPETEVASYHQNDEAFPSHIIHPLS